VIVDWLGRRSEILEIRDALETSMQRLRMLYQDERIAVGMKMSRMVPTKISRVESAIGILTMLFSHPGSMVRRSKLHRRPPLGHAARSGRSPRVMRRNHPKVKKRIFALASGWGPNPVREFYEKLEKDPAWTVRTIECGHDAMLDEPEEVVNILREAAEITLTKF